MLTIFAIPRPFYGHIDIIQRNAIRSWLKLSPKCEIILFGDEEGISKVADEYGIRHIPEIKRNEFGTPLLNSAFSLAQKKAKYDLLMHVSTDIILMPDFITAVKYINKPLFLMVGRRWDLDIREPIDFSIDWEQKLREDTAKRGKLHGSSGIDYFVFPRNLPHNLPAFAVGRPGWDNWLIYHIRSLRIPVIDATKIISIVHQNHDHSHCLDGKRDEGPEARKNFELTGGFSHMCTLRDADWVLSTEGLRRPGFLRRIFIKLSLFYPYRLLLSIKRRLQQFLL